MARTTHKWRASKVFVVVVISTAMFADTFLFSFIVPILQVTLEKRVKLNPDYTQIASSLILSMNALVSIIIAPLVGRLSDRVSKKNNLMVASWILNIFGTILTGWWSSLLGLFTGRLIQTISGSVIWIVGMAILGQTVGADRMSTTFGVVTMFITAGLFTGPAISGSLYEFVGYSRTWLTALAILMAGTTLQLIMVESPGTAKKTQIAQSKFSETYENIIESGKPDIIMPDDDDLGFSGTHSDDTEASETSSLLGGTQSSLIQPDVNSYQSISQLTSESSLLQSQDRQDIPSQNVYVLLLRQSRVLVSLVSDVVFAIILASLEATLPSHIQNVFGWRTLGAGLLFVLIQVPTLVLLGPIGLLKDKFGLRYPISIGFLLFVPSLWLLGLPGSGIFQWIGDKGVGPIIYIVALILIGICRTLVIGFGGVEVMQASNHLEEENPGIFGENGCYSRAFSVANIFWKIGMLIGPLISGALSESVGYYYMNVFLGESVLLPGYLGRIVHCYSYIRSTN
ncbi:major facilitator superfamily domain-containing protein [Talaromyces proteolyticus]|uniref:Major facilitator superfamily domain-containing protein n=1 Tax=Talaromyces proteolyticus TaxID=1131652 RepID=A0AAD4PY83_9EURO|nr:major facilitator superfamily domain-containing protein [Talaromyces proteolyticus]KAH8693806.1 major facilitator superfamily domain-containing protein [Talaromyces proteolyticus]